MNETEFQLPTTWPNPHDAEAAERLVERFAGIGRAEAKLVARPGVAAMLRTRGATPGSDDAPAVEASGAGT